MIVGDTSKFIDKLRALRPSLELVSADKVDLATATAAPYPFAGWAFSQATISRWMRG